MLRFLLLFALSNSFPAYSQPYPVKAIRLNVSYPARGGASGTIAAELGAWVREQTASWAKVVRAGNIKLE